MTDVLPTSLELLRAVRGNSIHAQGSPYARVVAQCALDLAEICAAESHDDTAAAAGVGEGQRAQLLDCIEDLLILVLPHLPDDYRLRIRGAIEQVAEASVELHRALRRHGGADERVLVLSRRTAELADGYTSLRASATRFGPWRPR